MSNVSALRRAVVMTAASALAVSAVMVAGATYAAAAVTPKTGGILTFLEHTPRLDHYDPSRIYTGRDLAFMNSSNISRCWRKPRSAITASWARNWTYSCSMTK